MAKSKSKSKSKPQSKLQPKSKWAIEGRKAGALANLYASDATILIIDRDNPPSNPRKFEGMDAISAFFNDVCGRDMMHKVENGVAAGNRLAFIETCAYPEGGLLRDGGT